MKRIRMNDADRQLVGTILTDLEVLEMADIAEAIAQAMETERGYDRDEAHRIATIATKRPDLFAGTVH